MEGLSNQNNEYQNESEKQLELQKETAELVYNEFVEPHERVQKKFLGDTVEAELVEFDRRRDLTNSAEDIAVAQEQFLSELAKNIRQLPVKSYEGTSLRLAEENDGINCVGCAVLTGLILENNNEKLGLKNIEFGNPYGHAVDIVTLADDRVLFVDTRNGRISDLQIGVNTTIEEYDGVKVYKVNSDKIGYKIIPATSVLEGGMGAYLENLIEASDEAATAEVAQEIADTAEREEFIASAQALWSESGFDLSDVAHLKEVRKSLTASLDNYQKSEEWLAEVQRIQSR